MLSVIIPVYQAEQVLEKCIDSVLAQSFQDLEIILVDDGSTDRSGVICDNYAKQDSRIKVIHKKNAGVSAARNSGLSLASGEYIAFVDSDDYLEPNMYQSMMDKMLKYNCDVVMCDCIKDFSDYSEVYTHNIRAGYYSKEQLYTEYYPHLLIMENVEYPPTISNWLLLFRSKLHSGKEIPRYIEDVRFSEDLLFGAQLLYAADSFYYMKGENLYHYWMNPKSVTHTFVPDKWNDYLKLIFEIKNSFDRCIDFDFHQQIDLVLLFFVYNAMGDIIGASLLDYDKKVHMCKTILRSGEVEKMFQRLHIMSLPVPFKLKIVTLIYKYKIGLKYLISRTN